MFGDLHVIVVVFSVTLLLPATRSQVCDTERDPDDGRQFRSVSTGEIRQCRKDFVFELSPDRCGACGILKIGYAMNDPCQADVEITFANGIISDVSQFTWLRSQNVAVRRNVEGSTNGFVGVFNGVSSSIEIPLYEYSELGARLEIKLRYRESSDASATRPDMAILSNNADMEMFPSFTIIHSMQENAVLAGLNTTGGNFAPFNIPLTGTMKSEWKTILFEYNAMATDGAPGKLTLEGSTTLTSTYPVIGNIQSLQTPFVIGRGAFFSDFNGELDYVRISRCSPVVGSTIN